MPAEMLMFGLDCVCMTTSLPLANASSRFQAFVWTLTMYQDTRRLWQTLIVIETAISHVHNGHSAGKQLLLTYFNVL